jgi:hypothetical protein
MGSGPEKQTLERVKRIWLTGFMTVALLLTVALPGMGFWPVYWELAGERNFLGPLVSTEGEGETARVTVRPLFSHDAAEGGMTRSFFPLGKSTPEFSYFVPIYTRTNTEEKWDVSFLLFFAGETKKRGGYGGFFPLGGWAYDKVGKDEIGFVLWPIYSYVKDQGAEKWNVLWPLFSVYGGKAEGFKAWPLFGRRTVPGERTNTFFLWPLFFTEERDLDTDNPRKSFYFIPFYLETKSKTTEAYSVLWPFFNYKRAPGRTEVDAPWPFYSRVDAEDEEMFRIWPLYSRQVKGRDRTTHYLWPLFKDAEWYTGERRNVERRVLLLGRYVDDDRGAFLNVWPFARYQSKGEDAAFFFPSILPFRFEQTDRLVRPLLTLYQYDRKGDTVTSNFLYGLYTKEQTGDAWRRRLAFLFEAKKESGGYGFELLSGLLGWDSKRVKILFIPIRRGNEEQGKGTRSKGQGEEGQSSME